MFHGCQEESYTSKVQDIFASIENMESAEIMLIPNPTSGNFTISNVSNATIYLYSSLGSHIKTFEHVSSQENINISHLSNGIYFLKIVEGNMIKNKKMILSK